jgi:hypothetical protein
LNTTALQLGFLLLVTPLYYYLAGSAIQVFLFFIFFFEIVNMRRLVFFFVLVALGLLLPFLSSSGVLLVRMKDAFLYPAFPEFQIQSMELLLYLSVPLLALLLYAGLKTNPDFLTKPKQPWSTIQMVVLVAIFFGTPFLTFNKTKKYFWHITYYARTGAWQKILDLHNRSYPTSPQITALVNRALCHTGQMGDNLFSYPQDFGLEGLFLMDDRQLSTPLIRSDLYFDLGHYNEAKHWAHEAVSVKGETAWILQRLVVVLIMYEQKNAARVLKCRRHPAKQHLIAGSGLVMIQRKESVWRIRLSEFVRRMGVYGTRDQWRKFRNADWGAVLLGTKPHLFPS